MSHANNNGNLAGLLYTSTATIASSTDPAIDLDKGTTDIAATAKDTHAANGIGDHSETSVVKVNTDTESEPTDSYLTSCTRIGSIQERLERTIRYNK